MGSKTEVKTKFKTPAPNAYDSEKGEDYIHPSQQKTFGIKPESYFQYCSVDVGIEEVSERTSFSEYWTLHCGIL